MNMASPGYGDKAVEMMFPDSIFSITGAIRIWSKRCYDDGTTYQES